MRGNASRALAVALLVIAVPVAEADIPVVLELVLALDSSASVDRQEFQLQLDGLSAAFADPDVLRQVETLKPFGAAIAVVQWGSPGETRVVLPFTHIKSSRDAKAFGFQIGLIRRWMHANSTSIASGIDDSRTLLESNEYHGLLKIIDVSGDGMDNSGADLKGARQRANAAGITVNGLPIMADDSTLDIYYRERVITGAASFIEPAQDFRDYIRAIRAKLLRELRPLQS